ncbi:MAG: hypothetical protein EBS53_13155 [Bacteroidetes bacterium]|nr:hypothetical protein [Bacteroidota bacterium]
MAVAQEGQHQMYLLRVLLLEMVELEFKAHHLHPLMAAQAPEVHHLQDTFLAVEEAVVIIEQPHQQEQVDLVAMAVVVAQPLLRLGQEIREPLIQAAVAAVAGFFQPPPLAPLLVQAVLVLLLFLIQHIMQIY